MMVRPVPLSAAVILLQLVVVQGRWGPHPALQELQSAKGWKFVLRKQGVKVWKRTGCDDNANFAVKATMLYPCSAQELAAILTTRDYDVIRKFNPTVVEGADLEWSNNRKERVTWILTKAVFPLLQDAGIYGVVAYLCAAVLFYATAVPLAEVGYHTVSGNWLEPVWRTRPIWLARAVQATDCLTA